MHADSLGDDRRATTGWSRRDVLVGAGFVAPFALLFLPMTFGGKLPGNCDTWLALALSETYVNELRTLFGASVGSAMFPVEDIHSYGESAPGLALLIIIPRLLGVGPLLSYGLFLTALFAGSAFGVYRLALTLTARVAPSIIAGALFATTGFLFANIDDPIVLFWLLPTLSIAWTLEAARDGDPVKLRLAACVGALQITCSVYIFVYQTLLLALLPLFDRRLVAPGFRRHLAVAGLIYGLLALPSGVYYVTALRQPIVPPHPEELRLSLSAFGLGADDLVHPLPNNLLYPAAPLEPDSFAFWVDQRQRAFVGFALMLLALLGVVPAGRHRRLLLTIGAIGLLLAWRGARWGPVHIEPLVALLHPAAPVVAFLRIGSRAYLLSALALSLLAAFGIARILDAVPASWKRWRPVLVATLLLVHVIENVPMPLMTFDVRPLIDAPSALMNLRQDDRPPVTVLDLPSTGFLRFDRFGDPLFTYNRELIYMVWQTQHRQNTVAGINGYFPRSRLEAERLAASLPTAEATAGLHAFGVDYLAFHRRMVLPPDTLRLAELRSASGLREVSDDGDTVLFAIDGGP